jgi:hypothetical protein
MPGLLDKWIGGLAKETREFFQPSIHPPIHQSCFIRVHPCLSVVENKISFVSLRAVRS